MTSELFRQPADFFRGVKTAASASASGSPTAGLAAPPEPAAMSTRAHRRGGLGLLRSASQDRNVLDAIMQVTSIASFRHLAAAGDQVWVASRACRSTLRLAIVPLVLCFLVANLYALELFIHSSAQTSMLLAAHFSVVSIAVQRTHACTMQAARLIRARAVDGPADPSGGDFQRQFSLIKAGTCLKLGSERVAEEHAALRRHFFEISRTCWLPHRGCTPDRHNILFMP